MVQQHEAFDDLQAVASNVIQLLNKAFYTSKATMSQLMKISVAQLLIYKFSIKVSRLADPLA